MATIQATTPSSSSRLQAWQSITCIWSNITTSNKPASTSAADLPSAAAAISSRRLPRTSAERLALAAPDYNGPKTASTVLYLAYGSNLSAQKFSGDRGVKPISAINVSAPALDLTFDLPGLPYTEPCFANCAPRKAPPKLPPLPGNPPIKPPPSIELPPHPTYHDDDVGKQHERNDTIDSEKGITTTTTTTLPALPIRRPTWDKGLYGVVYEVTQADYAKIIATEGGGASYADIATLCIALPPAIRVPEQPGPGLPDIKPFLAHTLYAPRLPAEPPSSPNVYDDDDKDKPGLPPKGGKWWQKYLLPVRRAEADYAQPSLRYLRLIREGAAENFLPFEYQQYLQKLEHYTVTRRRQAVGKWLFSLLWLPLLLLLLGLGKVFVGNDGKNPRWLASAMGVFFNLMWRSYDAFFKDRFGDGERTMEDEDEGHRSATRSRWYDADGVPNEKNRLLNDW